MKAENPGFENSPGLENMDDRNEEGGGGCFKTMWAQYDKHRTTVIFTSAMFGFALGFLLNYLEASEVFTSWLYLPGDLFIRALKCIVLPLVFVNVVLAVIQMLEVGQAVSIGWKAVGLYLGTTFIAAIEGLVIVLIFQGFFTSEDKTTDNASLFRFQCADQDSFITETDEGLFCLPSPLSGPDNNTFEATDINNVFSKAGASIKNDLSISQTLQDGIFRKLVSDNLVGDFVEANFASVIVFAIVFAVASFKMIQKKGIDQKDSYLLGLFHEIDEVFLLLINWVIALTPIAVISLIGGSLGGNGDLLEILKNLATLIGATFLGMLTHFLVVHVCLLGFVTKKNPFGYLKFLVPAQLFAFACASSAATIPVSTQSVKDSKQVPDTIRDFIVPLGATINMDGGAISFPIAIVFLAVTSGLSDQLNVATYILIIFISAIGSAGAAPIPASSLVLIITAFNTVFELDGTPEYFPSVVAADFIIDRLATALNVTGDMVICRMVTALTSEDELQILDARKLSLVEEKVEDDTHRRLSLYEETREERNSVELEQ